MPTASQSPQIRVDKPGQFCYNDAATPCAERGTVNKFGFSKSSISLSIVLLATAGFGVPSAAHAESLLVNRVQQEQSMDLPSRGMSMAEVEKKYGAPQHKLTPRGGDSAKHPVINRWDYSNFIVYFEKSHVIHAVLNTPAGNNTNPASAN
ncbi:hypothetical protein DYST_00228 [Dyella terrae]|nr:hypothetical protein DYST_00228 [Dyella terrae]